MLYNIWHRTVKDKAKRIYSLGRDCFSLFHTVNSIRRDTMFENQFIFSNIFPKQCIKKRLIRNQLYPSLSIYRENNILNLLNIPNILSIFYCVLSCTIISDTGQSRIKQRASIVLVVIAFPFFIRWIVFAEIPWLKIKSYSVTFFRNKVSKNGL